MKSSPESQGRSLCQPC